MHNALAPLGGRSKSRQPGCGQCTLAHHAATDLGLQVRQEGRDAAFNGAAEQGGLGKGIVDLIVGGNQLAVLKAAKADVAPLPVSTTGRFGRRTDRRLGPAGGDA